MAELWEPTLAWEMGWRKVVSELDLGGTIEIISYGCRENNQCKSIVSSIQNMLKLNWTAKVSHCYREANMVANGLANHASILEC